ncbi:cold-shock protein [Curtobacterium sp. TXMA1]|uniref:cold-shock protein n=1 Tax=Curtobacterium sp. TXMA1 TaxID=2876939 RepID=UPI001CCB7E76|nr:cold shock domain-containing protein [Curtobacterium sp. TXMA1]
MVDSVCVWWSDEDGRGALRSNEVESEVFVHFSNINRTRHHLLRPGQRVLFEVEPYPRGRDGYFFRAHNVTTF